MLVLAWEGLELLEAEARGDTTAISSPSLMGNPESPGFVRRFGVGITLARKNVGV